MSGLPKPYCDEGGITIYHGDCRDVLPIAGTVAVVTDPPYGMGYQSGWSKKSNVAGDDTVEVRDRALSMLDGLPALVFGRWSAPRPIGTRTVLYWDKGDWPGMGDLKLPWGPSTEEIYVIGHGFVGKRRGQIIRDPRRPMGNAYHPTEKPTGIMRILIEACPPGAVIDPFMGSGSTLVAAKGLGRRAIGIELEERYCEIAARRMAQEVLL